VNIKSSEPDIDELFTALRQRVTELQRVASTTNQATNLSHIEEAGMRIRAERKKQGLTLNELCDLSGVAYVTLGKIEKGSANIRLESLINVTKALGLKLCLG
jgi:DNA-binding XRE family transcriptional regulator